MKAAFYRLGDSYIGTKAFMKAVGLEPIYIPPPNKKMISEGVLNAPEFACYPFKVSLGMFFYALDQGAEVYIMPSPNNQLSCQLTDFAQVQEYIVKKKGVKFDILRMDTLHPQRLMKKFKRYNPKLTLRQLTKALYLGRQKVLLLEQTEECRRKIFLSEGKTKAEAFKKKWLKKIDETNGVAELYSLGVQIGWDYSNYKKLDVDNMIKIGLIGDIYCLNENAVNNNIYERLLSMDVYVNQGIKFSNMLGGGLKLSMREMMLQRKADAYLKHNIAVYAKETIKDAIRYAEHGYDGLIQIYPFNCMPEVTARNILPKVSKDFNIPILYLAVDEQTGDAGFTTRLEAFVDLLKIRKRKK